MGNRTGKWVSGVREGKREGGGFGCERSPCDRAVLYLTVVVAAQIFT